MYDRSRGRRVAFAKAEAARQPPPPPPRAPGTHHTERFHVQLNGYGDIGLLDYVAPASEYARIEFQCRVPGRLTIRVDGRIVLSAPTAAGLALVTGLFFPGGCHVTVIFTNEWAGGSINGTINISPAPVHDVVAAARAAFNLPANYTADMLKRAHQKLVIRWHPDKPGGDNAKMSEINHYNDVLKARLQ